MKIKTIKLLSDRVLIEPSVVEDKTLGGIIIPDTAKEKPQKGIVIAVGPGKSDKDAEVMTLNVGDFVLYGKYSGNELTIDGKDYLIMRETDVIAVI